MNPSIADVQICLSHIGYFPSSPKIMTLVAKDATTLPERIPFYIRINCFRMPRRVDTNCSEYFSERFTYPYDLLHGPLMPPDTYIYRGELQKQATRWGIVWQADFSDFRQPGTYQIETDYQVSVPFQISEYAYESIILGYMNFLRAQRCGCQVYGIHPTCHLDDGVLDTNGKPWPVTGGWHDAGDFRKWLIFTLYHLDTLALIYEYINPSIPSNGGPYGNAFMDEIAWGNRFFHGMITNQGQVFGDVGGGSTPQGLGLTYENDWWFENHAGCYADASDNRWTDNEPNSGDERKIRATYNPFIQFSFIYNQARVSQILPTKESRRCLNLAEKAWQYALKKGHDGRTLFLSVQLRAALELVSSGSKVVVWQNIMPLASELLSRQDKGKERLNSYFMEKHHLDAFRSITFAADPVLTLIRMWELRYRAPSNLQGLIEEARQAIERYIDNFLLADAASNPFGLTPYGVYLEKPHADKQVFRDAGQGRGVRTFMHPLNKYGIVHGTNGVLMSHAHLIARAGFLFNNRNWQHAAEKLLHWSLGHNLVNRSLFIGLGYRHPIGYSFRIPHLLSGMLIGFIGRPDDTPYLEESMAIEWNTLEYWSVPTFQAAAAVVFLR